MRYSQFIHAFIVCFTCGAVNGAELSIDTALKVQSSYNDNVTLAYDNEISSVSTSMIPQLNFHAKELDQVLDVKADINLRRYKDYSELNSEEAGLGINWTKLYERTTLKVLLDYTRYSSLNDDLDISGIVDQLVIKKTTSVSPTLSYKISESMLIELTASYYDTEYDEPGFEGYDTFKIVNYMNNEVSQYSVGLVDKVTENDKFTLSISRMDYKGKTNGLQYLGTYIFAHAASERRLDYVYDLAKLNYLHEFTETEAVSMTYGISKQNVEEYSRVNIFDLASLDLLAEGYWELKESSENANVFDLEFSSKMSDGLVSASFSRSRSQSVADQGGIVETDQLVMRYVKKISERLGFKVDANKATTKNTADTVEIQTINRDRNSITVGASWKLTPDWVLAGGYRYLEQVYDVSDTKTSSNYIYLNLTFAWPKLLSTY